MACRKPGPCYESGMSRPLGPLSQPLRAPGLVLAALALLCQLALGAVLPHAASAQAASGIETIGTLCIADAPAHTPGHHQHRGDCALCPLCLSMAAQAVLPVAAPPLPLPRSEAAPPATLPPLARGPPAPRRLLAFPRGPPVLT